MPVLVVLFGTFGGIVGWRMSARRRRRRSFFDDDPLEGSIERYWRKLPRPMRRFIVTVAYTLLGVAIGLALAVLRRR